MASCPGCLKEIRKEWKFCRFCGRALLAQTSELETSLREHIPVDVLARRIGPGEMQGLLNRSVVVEEGQSALLLIGGRHDLTLGPGKHSMGNILASRTRDVTVVLFRTSDVPLEASVSRLLSSDPLPLTLDFSLILKVEEPMRFWRNLANGVDSYHTTHLAAAMYAPVEEGCQAFVGSRTVRELDGSREIGRELGLSLASHLERPLSRWGLALVSCQAVSIHCEAWDEISQSRSDYSVATLEGQTELEGRKRLFDVYQESQIQTIAEETAAVVGVEKRLSLWERLRQAMLSNAQGEIRSQTELEDLVRQADKDKLLKEEEHQTLLRTMAEAHDDHEKSKDFGPTQGGSRG